MDGRASKSSCAQVPIDSENLPCSATQCPDARSQILEFGAGKTHADELEAEDFENLKVGQKIELLRELEGSIAIIAKPQLRNRT
jgi:hypothetical protein